MARTWLSIRIDLVAGHGEHLWPSAQDALSIGERALVLQRLIQLDFGFSPDEDFVIADRLLEKLTSGPAAGHGIGPAELRLARDEYYGYAGFSTETGAPNAAVLARLGLAPLAVGQP